MLALTDALDFKQYALYIFDYGAPTGLRLALARPESVTAIISQNGNAYEEGLGDAWAPIRRYWSEPSTANRETLRKALTPEGIRREYSSGMPNPDEIAPEGWTFGGITQTPSFSCWTRDISRWKRTSRRSPSP